MLGGGDRVAERRVHYNDALGGGRRDVDIVDPDAGAPDHLEAFGALENLRRDLGGGADGEPVEAIDGRRELLLVLAEIGLEVDLKAAILEDLHGRRRQRIGNQNSGRHVIYSPSSCAGLTRASRLARRRAPLIGMAETSPAMTD